VGRQEVERMQQKMKALLIYLGLAAISTGCATPKPTLYQWGGYQDSIYAMYADPGKASPEAMVTLLEAAAAKAASANKSVPPGYHAQLGYLYFQTGKPDLAAQAFARERDLFPESKVYMDRLLTQVKK
jgi:hypothetical protein